MDGYTAVWSGRAMDWFNVVDRWQSLVGTEARKAVNIECNHMSVYIANEFIDWAHYRNTGEYICCYGQNVVNPTR